MLARVEVGKHSEFLKLSRSEVLRFVKDQNGPPPMRVLLMQEALESSVQADVRLVERLPRRHHDELQQFLAAAGCIRNQTDSSIGWKLADEVPDKSRLAGTDVTGDDREAGVVPDAELEHRERKA